MFELLVRKKNWNALLYSLAIRFELLFNSLLFTGRPTIVLFLGSWYFGHMVDFCFRKQFFFLISLSKVNINTLLTLIQEIYVAAKPALALVTIKYFLLIQNYMHSIFSVGKFYIWLVGWFDSLSSQHPLSINHKNYWHKHCGLCV